MAVDDDEVEVGRVDAGVLNLHDWALGGASEGCADYGGGASGGDDDGFVGDVEADGF